jgi:hypothetical protein
MKFPDHLSVVDMYSANNDYLMTSEAGPMNGGAVESINTEQLEDRLHKILTGEDKVKQIGGGKRKRSKKSSKKASKKASKKGSKKAKKMSGGKRRKSSKKASKEVSKKSSKKSSKKASKKRSQKGGRGLNPMIELNKVIFKELKAAGKPVAIKGVAKMNKEIREKVAKENSGVTDKEKISKLNIDYFKKNLKMYVDKSDSYMK